VHDDDNDEEREVKNTGDRKCNLSNFGTVSVVESVWCNDHRAHTNKDLKINLKTTDD